MISYDGAAYTATPSIVGLNGGSGWRAEWSGANNVVSNGFAFASLLVAGTALLLTATTSAPFARYQRLCGIAK